MIPSSAPVIDVIDTLDGERIDMSLDPDGLQFIQSLLTDQYSDQEKACIREYSTNAWDSHMEAGVTRPIEVQTPNALSPYLVIKDYGVGMDRDDIKNVYSLYLNSTKRTLAHANGSLGIGAKSALSLTSQFTVTAVKNGVKTLVSISRNTDGTGTMKIVYTGETDEPNGVEVKIPASNHVSFLSKAKDFFRFWKKGTVLLNGLDPTEQFEMITDKIALLPQSDFNDYVVMGNVAYPVVANKRFSIGSRCAALFVEMGGSEQINFPPSRESLMYTPQTEAVLESAKDAFEGAVVKHVERDIATSKTYLEAYNKMRNHGKWVPLRLLKDVRYNGEGLSNFKIVKDDGGGIHAVEFFPNRNRNSVLYSKSQDVYFERISEENAIVIVNYPSKAVPSESKDRIRRYFADQQIPLNTKKLFLFSDSELPMQKYTSDIFVYDWKDILKDTRVKRASTTNAGTYEACIKGDWNYSYEVSNADDVIFVSPAYGVGQHGIKAYSASYHQYVFIVTPENRHAKLKRLVKSAKPWHEFNLEVRREKTKIEFGKLTDDDFRAYAWNRVYNGNVDAFGFYSSYNLSHVIDALFSRVDKIADPEYAEIVRMVKAGSSVRVSLELSVTEEFTEAVAAHIPEEKKLANDYYPLLKTISSIAMVDDAIDYINMAYAKRMENQNGLEV